MNHDCIFDLTLEKFLERFMDRHDGAWIRMHIIVQNAAIEERLPYPSLGAYLCAGPERIKQMLNIPSFGIFSVHKFDKLAAEVANEFNFEASRSRYRDYLSHNQTPDILNIFNIPLNEFLARLPTVDLHLKRAIDAAVANGDCPFNTVSDYLRAGGSRLVILCSIPKVGEISAQRFEELVQITTRTGILSRSEMKKIITAIPMFSAKTPSRRVKALLATANKAAEEPQS